MDQVTEHRLDQPADSREGLVLDQRQGSQAPAPTRLLTSQNLGQTLATSTGDSDSQRNIGENGEEERRVRKRKIDRAYRQRKKDGKKALEDENDRLKQENDEQKQRIKSMLEDNEKLKWKLEEREGLCNSLQDRIAGANVQSMSTTYMQQLLDGVKLGIFSLNQKVDGLQQNITQLLGTQVYASQSDTLISPDFQADWTTRPLTRLDGTSRMRPTFQSPETFTDDSHVLPYFLPQQQVGQTAYPNDVLPQFSSHEGQGVNSAIEPQPFMQGLSDQYQFSSENLNLFSNFQPPFSQFSSEESDFSLGWSVKHCVLSSSTPKVKICVSFIISFALHELGLEFFHFYMCIGFSVSKVEERRTTWTQSCKEHRANYSEDT
ncbi:hypothetical protein SLEP1_g26533 [Rubroshorea leprosula]|uniref:BZIP domain-containing protein n=1 Tax=Rubroshorea leprosula TaxID=152421 RepID=A0AAV5JW00_9ROSI|nr:hypothetical protein SLEP1_g26533 [Rubroshorea leprosula]